MKDRFYNGFIAGFVGTLTPIVINLSSSALGLTTVLWSDFMSLLVSGSTLEGTTETVFYIGLQSIFLGFLGGIFALIIPNITSKHYLFKGALFGTLSMIVFFSFPLLFQLPELREFPLATVISNLISASLWGLTMVFILKKLDNKVSH